MSLPQREGRPALSLKPDATPDTAAWVEQHNDPMNDLNKPVPERKGKPDANGWINESYDVNHDEEI
jgi:hypothetical protein